MNPADRRQAFAFSFGPPRRPNSATPRTRRRYIKLTEEEDRELRAIADSMNITVARFLWEASMARPSQLTPDQQRALGDLRMLIIPLRNLADFTNGLARIANTEKRFPAEAREIYPIYARLTHELRNILRRISG